MFLAFCISATSCNVREKGCSTQLTPWKIEELEEEMGNYSWRILKCSLQYRGFELKKVPKKHSKKSSKGNVLKKIFKNVLKKGNYSWKVQPPIHQQAVWNFSLILFFVNTLSLEMISMCWENLCRSIALTSKKYPPLEVALSFFLWSYTSTIFQVWVRLCSISLSGFLLSIMLPITLIAFNTFSTFYSHFYFHYKTAFCEASFNLALSSSPSAESAGAEYWQTAPPPWCGGRLFATSDRSPHEKGRNSETKSRKTTPNMPKRNATNAHWQKSGSQSKNGFLGKKTLTSCP